MNQSDYEKAIKKEAGEWPGVEVELVSGGKHPKAKFTFQGKILSVSYSGTPSDASFGVHQMLGDMRRAMKKLGAERAKPEPSKDQDEAPYRPKNNGKEQRPSPIKSVTAKAQPDITEQLVEQGVVTKEEAATAKTSVQGPGSAATYERRAVLEGIEDDIKAAFDTRVAGIEDGIYFDLPADVYHAVPRLSCSGIQKMCVSPGTFWRDSWLDPNKTEDDDDAAWKVTGRAYHTARLEPHLFDQLYVRDVGKDEAPKGTLFTGAELKAELKDSGLVQSGAVLEQAERLADSGFPEELLWPIIKRKADEERGDRLALAPSVYDDIANDMNRIRGNGQIAPLLTGGEAEVSIFWTDEHGVQMKARCDYLTREWWVDFKTFDNSRGKQLNQALCDAVRYNRYYIQATVYREAIEAVRLGGIPIRESQTDDQKKLVAALQIRPAELDCWFVFQEKKGIPNLLAREFPFYMVPFTTVFNEQITADEARREAVREMTRKRTQLFMRGVHETLEAKKNFVLYSTVYLPGDPWAPIDALGTFSDDDFHPYWLAGTMV